MKKKFFYLSIVLLIFLTLFSCKKNKTTKKEIVFENSIFAVDTTTVVKGELNDYIKLSGDIKSTKEIKVYPDQQGKIAVIHKVLGQYVSQGEVIMEIDPSKPGMIYSNSPVRAPVDGNITSLPFKIGETVNFQTPVATIGRLYDLECVVYISEKYVNKIKKGLQAIITVSSYPEETFYATIREVSPIIDPNSRMMEVKLSFTSENKKLLIPGMFANIKIIVENKNNIYKIPQESLINRYGENFVFVIKDLPSEIDNINLDKLYKKIQTFNSDDKTKYSSIIENNVKKVLPETLKSDFVEFKLFKDKSLEKTKFENLYSYNKEKDIYELKDKNSFDETLWNLFIKYNHKYNINLKQDIEIRELFIKCGFIEEDNRFVEKRNVTYGIVIDNKVEILQGLKDKEEIVVSGASLLEDNSIVKIISKKNILTVKDTIKK